jgi:endonuclease YncB( thermonuclease family)
LSVVRLLHVLVAVCAAVPASAEPMARCHGPYRTTCVVNGDTVWIAGEKIRLADIDAPEVEGQCNAERQGAARAAERLAELLSTGPYLIERRGLDVEAMKVVHSRGLRSWGCEANRPSVELPE